MNAATPTRQPQRLHAPRVWILLCAAACAAPAFGATPSWPTLSAGDITVVVRPWGQGMLVTQDGIAVIKRSSLVVTKPPWAPHYYVGPSKQTLAGAQHVQQAGAAQLILDHRDEAGTFAARETLTLHADGTLVQQLDGQLLAPDSEAKVEWCLGALDPTLIIGRPYRATLKNGATITGTVPVALRSASRAETTLAAGFTSIEFDSRVGPLRIETDAAHDLIIFDYRLDRWADPDNPCFWFGDLGSQFKTGQRIHYEITYHLPPSKPAAPDVEPVHARAPVLPLATAQTYPRQAEPTVIPRPKQAEYTPGGYVLSHHHTPNERDVLLVLPPEESAAHANSESAARLLTTLLAEDYGVQLRIADRTDETSASLIRFAPHAGEPPLPAEGYVLNVTPQQIEVHAGDARGFINAVQTLRQLTTLDASGDVLVCSAQIRDWPTLAFRGVHLFTGGQGPDIHLTLIRNVLGALKLNHLVLECEYINWDSHPEIHHPTYGMPKPDVRKILTACAAHGIEVTPLISSLGHSRWLFTNDQHLDLAEDPDAKWAYCPTNPAVYDLLFEIYTEALDLFQPRWLHIGHDEVAQFGRFPYRDSSTPYTAEQLLLMDTQRLHDWLAQRGVGTMLWGDMLLAPGEAPDACNAASTASADQLRAALPHDILVTDWHYAAVPPAAYTSLAQFHAAGYQTVAATWDRPENIVGFTEAAHANDSRGLLQTTWAGYSLDPQSFRQNLDQYAAYVLAAEAAWNADTPPDATTYPAGERFLDCMSLSTLRPANRAGWTADLSAARNYSLAAADAAGWFGLGPDNDLAPVPTGSVRLKGLAFEIGTSHDHVAGKAIALRSRLTQDAGLPAVVTLELNARAALLAILHTTNFACQAGARVGQYELEYDDGTRTTIDLVYGDNIFACTDRTPAPAAPIVWTGTTRAGHLIALRALLWENPSPHKSIRTLTARSADAAGALLLIGLTGLDDVADSE